MTDRLIRISSDDPLFGVGTTLTMTLGSGSLAYKTKHENHHISPNSNKKTHSPVDSSRTRLCAQTSNNRDTTAPPDIQLQQERPIPLRRTPQIRKQTPKCTAKPRSHTGKAIKSPEKRDGSIYAASHTESIRLISDPLLVWSPFPLPSYFNYFSRLYLLGMSIFYF